MTKQYQTRCNANCSITWTHQEV